MRNSIPVKKMTLVEYVKFLKKNGIQIKLAFNCGSSFSIMDLQNPVDFHNLSSFSLNLNSIPDDKDYDTLKDAFYALVDQQLKKLEKVENDIKNSYSLFKYSILGMMIPSNRENKKILDNANENFCNYKKFLKDKNALADYYNLNYKNSENLINQEISIPDVDSLLGIGSSVYCLYSNLFLHSAEDIIEKPFFVSELSVVNIDYDRYFYQNINNIDIFNNESFDLKIKLEFIPDDNLKSFFGATPVISFEKDPSNEKSLLLKQGYGNFRMFLTKDDCDSYINELKSLI